MLGVAKRTKVGCVFGLTELRFPDGKKKITHPIKYSKDGKSWICTTSVHPTLFDRELFVTKLCFTPDVKTHEDRVNAYLILKHCKTALINRVMYYYNIHPTSLVRDKLGRAHIFEDIIRVWEKLKLEKGLFTEGEWELVKDDLTWSAASPLFFLHYVAEPDRIERAKWMVSILNTEFPKWKEHETITGIRKENFIVGQYVDMLLNEKFDKDFIKFTNGFKMKLIDVGTEVYTVGGWKSWVKTKLSRE
jgi:hypothetical protein